MKKRGVFFSTDALIALIIIFLSILIVFPIINYAPENDFVQEDILKVFSSIKVGEIDNSYVQQLISEGKITDLNKSVLEQMGEFYVTNLSISKAMAESVLENIDERENIGIWYGTKLLASKNITDYESSDNVKISRRIISGIKEGESVTGFSSRAYLQNNIKTKYFYFGGYVGEGNISAIINYTGNLDNVKIELTSNTDFDIYINGIFSGHYASPIDDFTPAEYFLGAYKDNFQSGNNLITFAGNQMHIAGGYIKITYSEAGLFESQSKRYYFPGIDGLINLYDGFYIPGTLNKMKISLHYDSSYELFMRIGNVTVFNGSSSGEASEIIDDVELSSLIDYNSLNYKTTPLRLGLYEINYNATEELNADVFSVAPLPSSFNAEGGVEIIADANRYFINEVLKIASTRVGLIGIDKDGVDLSDYHNLTKNITSLNETLNNWKLKGGVCMCCGINKAVQSLIEQSSSSNYKSVLVMADNEPTSGCGGNAAQDAIDAACNAYENYEIEFNTIALGSNTKGQNMLKKIANCTNGAYYEGDYEKIVDLYKEVAEHLIQLIYYKQSSISFGNINSTKLYPDSYIEFDYTGGELPYGLVLNSEEKFIDTYTGIFNKPNESQALEAKVISYSGPRWTNQIFLNNISVYNLSSYSSNYIGLGDPYHINLPVDLISDTNEIRLTTAISPQNYSEGSIHNKILYKIIKNITSYSAISSSAIGCIWTIDFDDYTNITVSIPSNYSGENYCYYQENKKEYDGNDALQKSAFYLLEELDLNNNGMVDVKFSEQDLVISSSQITGIPFGWSTEVQVRKWH